MPVVITLSGTLTEGSEVSDVETVLMFIEETGTSEGFASQAVTMDKVLSDKVFSHFVSHPHKHVASLLYNTKATKIVRKSEPDFAFYNG